MKVAIIYSHLNERGGVENVIYNQIQMLRKKGYDAEGYFAYVDEKVKKPTNPHCYMHSYLEKLVPNRKTLRIIASLPLAPLTAKFFRKTDVLVCHGYGSAPWIGYVLKKLKGQRYISYIHFLPRMFYLEREERNLWCFDTSRRIIFQLSQVFGGIVKKIDFCAVAGSDRVLVNSWFTGRRLKRVYGVDFTVCYPPVDTEVFKPVFRSGSFYGGKRAESGPLVFSSGRIVAIKRWEWLVQVLPYLKKEFPSVRVAIAGEISGESREYVRRLVKLAERLGVKENLSFLGFQPRDKLVRFYCLADAYAYPTPREDFGLGPVEAMACGTPAVVWNDGGGPCETVVDGETGFRAKPYLFEDFAEKLIKCFEMKSSERQFRMHKYVREKFSCQAHLKILEETLQSLS